MTDQALEGYWREAASWDADRSAQLQRHATVGWCVAAAGWICAVAGAVCLIVLLPLKRVEPFVVRVDNSTGIVDVVPVYAGDLPAREVVTRYFLSHYITVCERFNYTTAESDYEECGAFHTAHRNQTWYALWNTTNPRSPLNLHKDGSSVRVSVESVSFFKRAQGPDDLAQVRYVKAQRAAGGAAEQVSHWIATIQYAYGSPPQQPQVRRWNPLGFKIVDLTSEPEAPAAVGNASDERASP